MTTSRIHYDSVALLSVSSEKPREIAVRALQRHEESTDYIENILEDELRRASIAALDRRLVEELTFGVVRWKATLDWLIDHKASGRRQKPALRILLRLGLYQIFWLTRIPDHAAVHETVELAKRLGFGPQSGFINAVIRAYVREKEETKRLVDNLRETKPAIGYSHPEWLVERWAKRWDKRELLPLLEWDNTPARVFARVNTLATDAAHLITQWRAEGVEYDFFQRDWTGENLIFELKSFPSLKTLPSFGQGKFYVQDPSTLLAVRELNPQPGERVLDLCAAPGGKTTFIAQEMDNRGQIVAEDASNDRLNLVRENCVRLGVKCVETVLPPIAETQPRPLFDRVLVDAPCSNTGVMRRRVDLRWRIRWQEIERLQKEQGKLLAVAAARVRQGGILVYSTCSLETEENEEVVRTFLKGSPGFQLESERELLPFRDGVDGAYIARLSRK
ncbi:MAG: 16S rRNA (cytosine(967)-C(5))-methyltransferase RsmB [Verrucomicrobia bacterium]|nr:16S rRNA (cytosine(967)-C(5))-methyltransferase RsmB [Verrucomicrobiota bacterium]